MGRSGPHVIGLRGSLDPPECKSQKASRPVQPLFGEIMAECPYTLQWAALRPQNCPFPWVDVDPLLIMFFRPTRVLNPNDISIGSAVFAGLTTVTGISTERPTDHCTRSVTIVCTYIHATAMPPNNSRITSKICYFIIFQ